MRATKRGPCIVALLLTIALGLFGSMVRSVGVNTLSGVDEAQHWDNVVKYSRFQIPRYEGQIVEGVADAVRCHDVDPVDDRPAEVDSGSDLCHPARYAGVIDAGPYEAGQPPLYYAAVAVIERTAGNSGVQSVPKHLRMFNAAVLALLMVVVFFALALTLESVTGTVGEQDSAIDRGRGRVACLVAVVGPVALLLSPAVIEASAIVSNDLLAVLASAVCVLLYQRSVAIEQSAQLSVLLGTSAGVLMALTKATTVVSVCVLLCSLVVTASSDVRRRSYRQQNIFSVSTILAWIAATGAWSMLVDRLTHAPIRSLPVFQLWREPLAAVVVRAVRGIPILTLRGAFGANEDSLAYRIAHGVGWALILSLVLSALTLALVRSPHFAWVASIVIGIWLSGPLMAVVTHFGTGKAHADSRLMLAAVPWVLIALSVSAQSIIRGRLSGRVVGLASAVCLSLVAVSYGTYLSTILAT